MAVPKKYAVKDVRLSFQKKLKPELVCCTCNAVIPKGLKDDDGHIFCQACVAVHTGPFNQFRYSLRRRETVITDMTGNKEEWEILKKMKVALLNVKMFPFTGAIQDIVRQYKTCSCHEKVKCPWCDVPQDRQTFEDHIRDECPQRPMVCDFCGAYAKSCNKLKHYSNCRQRPGTCEHCGSDFETVAELEDKHIPNCPMVLVSCSFKPLGCAFYGARQKMAGHESSGEHNVLLLREVLLVKEENKILRESLQEQEKKYEMRVVKLQEELGHVKQHCSKLDEQLRKQERQFQVEKSKDLRGQFAVQEFMARLKEATMTLRRELHLDPDQDEDVAAPTQDPELEKRTKNTEEEGAGV